jgi:hypothetical protein
MKQYYYLDSNNRQSGPVDAGQLTRYGITRDMHVWTEGMSQWQPAGLVPELAGLFPPAVAPPQMAPPPPPVQPPVVPSVAPKIKILLRTPKLIALAAAVAAIVLSLLSIPLSALTASLFNARPTSPPIVMIVITGILVVLCLIIRKYRKPLNFCLLLPVLLSAAFGSFYYFNQSAGAFHNGYCSVHDYSRGYGGHSSGLINRFGRQIIPCEYDDFKYEPGIIIGIQWLEGLDRKLYYYDLKGNFLYNEERPKR